jgi:hypothetical protein
MCDLALRSCVGGRIHASDGRASSGRATRGSSRCSSRSRDPDAPAQPAPRRPPTARREPRRVRPDRPIVVQPETHYIVAGNHTYRAAVEVLAWTHIAIVKPELEPAEYERYLLMDNRASDMSEYDEDALIPILERLQDSGDFAYTGWDDDADRGLHRRQRADQPRRRARIPRRPGRRRRPRARQRPPVQEARGQRQPADARLQRRRLPGRRPQPRHPAPRVRHQRDRPHSARALANQFDLIYHGADA